MAGLAGMKEICDYCRRCEVTILKWVRVEKFPAAKIGGAWESDTELIDDWRKGKIIASYKRSLEPKKRKK